jgi:aminomethyltransferase
MGLRRTPLYGKHRQAGAKMVAFAGWEMPLQYGGIISEHRHTRTHAGLFDVSHMGELIVEGPGALSDVDRLLTCRIDDLKNGRCRYGFLLDERAGIIDDLIVFKISSEKLMLVVNAGTTDKDGRWVQAQLKRSRLKDITLETAKMDLQGPDAESVMLPLLPEAADLPRFAFLEAASRTGYTGESGFELFLPAADAKELWDALLDHANVLPVGLGARDTLRMEKGYLLYGNDIDETRNPVEANLERFVFRDKDFIGKAGLPVPGGSAEVMTGFVCTGRRSARPHYRIFAGAGAAAADAIGEVTSGAFSPSLVRGIGLAYVARDFAVAGAEITLSDGKADIQGRLKSPPFYP